MQNGNRKPRLFLWASLLAGSLYLFLFYQLLFTPVEMLAGFGVAGEAHTVFLARRISVLMLGFAVLLFLSCRLESSFARVAIASAVAVNMAGFAVNSFYGVAGGLLGRDLIVVGLVESVVAGVFGAFAVCDLLRLRRNA